MTTTDRHPTYPRTFSPLDIGDLRLKNRIVRSAHGTGFANGSVTDRLIEYHEQRARGGVALSIIEIAGVVPNIHSSIDGFSDDSIAGWARLADRCAVHGMALIQQLYHPGSAFPTRDGSPSWSASSIPHPVSGRVPIAMTRSMIHDLVDAYAKAATRCMRAGLAGVEVHAAHGYLLCQFLSPATNRRDDEYGVGPEGRSRILHEILRAIRRSTGAGFTVGVRLSGSEHVDGGLDEPAVADVAVGLERAGLVDYVNLSTGSQFSRHKIIGAMHEPVAYERDSNSTITAELSVPTIVGGRIPTIADAERLLADGVCDLVSMVRATIADPRIVHLSHDGKEHSVRPCIYCNQACVGERRSSGGVIACVVNPDLGTPTDGSLPQPVNEPRRVIVVGGGPAGMEAARTAALRGHSVTLHERSAALGGLVAAARRAPFRAPMGAIIDHLEREVRTLGVDVHLNSEVNLSAVDPPDADAVIVATGASFDESGSQRHRPKLSPDGLDQPHVTTPVAVLHGEVPLGVRRAVVFDDIDLYPAIGAAEALLEAGVEVRLVSSGHALAAGMADALQQDPICERLEAYESFEFVGRSALTSVDPATVEIESLDSGERRRLDADLVVLVTGLVPQRPDLDAFDDRVTVVGDALAPGYLRHAITTGRRSGMQV